MDIATFRRGLQEPAPPPALSLTLQALWWDGKGDWQRAHECAQQQGDAAGSAVHAYLHRKEGDLSNARYWYSRAGRAEAAGALEGEWAVLVEELLAS